MELEQDTKGRQTFVWWVEGILGTEGENGVRSVLDRVKSDKCAAWQGDMCGWGP